MSLSTDFVKSVFLNQGPLDFDFSCSNKVSIFGGPIKGDVESMPMCALKAGASPWHNIEQNLEKRMIHSYYSTSVCRSDKIEIVWFIPVLHEAAGS